MTASEHDSTSIDHLEYDFDPIIVPSDLAGFASLLLFTVNPITFSVSHGREVVIVKLGDEEDVQQLLGQLVVAIDEEGEQSDELSSRILNRWSVLLELDEAIRLEPEDEISLMWSADIRLPDEDVQLVTERLLAELHPYKLVCEREPVGRVIVAGESTPFTSEAEARAGFEQARDHGDPEDGAWDRARLWYLNPDTLTISELESFDRTDGAEV